MTRADRQLDAEIREREADKKRLTKLVGEQAVGDAIMRLCRNCTEPCNGKLYPLTSTGKDCPYFTPKKEVKKCRNTRVS